VIYTVTANSQLQLRAEASRLRVVITGLEICMCGLQQYMMTLACCCHSATATQ